MEEAVRHEGYRAFSSKIRSFAIHSKELACAPSSLLGEMEVQCHPPICRRSAGNHAGDATKRPAQLASATRGEYLTSHTLEANCLRREGSEGRSHRSEGHVGGEREEATTRSTSVESSSRQACNSRWNNGARSPIRTSDYCHLW